MRFVFANTGDQQDHEDTMTDTTEKAPAKSIIGAKYRDGRYKTKDWLATTISGVVETTKEVTKTVKDGDETKSVKATVSDGIDVNALFALAKANGLDVTKYDAQRDSHGFPGRFRMTVRNMLQKVAKQRHGIIVDGKFTPAPADWLEAKGAEAKPTHTEQGEKIAKPKPAKEEAAGDNADADKADTPAKAKPAPAAKAAAKK